MILTCSTCGAVVISMDEHLKFITARRERYGATWQLERRKTYTPIIEAYAVSAGQHDRDEADNGS